MNRAMAAIPITNESHSQHREQYWGPPDFTPPPAPPRRVDHRLRAFTLSPQIDAGVLGVVALDFSCGAIVPEFPALLPSRNLSGSPPLSRFW
jgi:hypothetical protein